MNNSPLGNSNSSIDTSEESEPFKTSLNVLPTQKNAQQNNEMTNMLQMKMNNQMNNQTNNGSVYNMSANNPTGKEVQWVPSNSHSDYSNLTPRNGYADFSPPVHTIQSQWSEDELKKLNECLVKYPSTNFHNGNDRFIKMAEHIKSKNLTEVYQKIAELKQAVNSQKSMNASSSPVPGPMVRSQSAGSMNFISQQPSRNTISPQLQQSNQRELPQPQQENNSNNGPNTPTGNPQNQAGQPPQAPTRTLKRGRKSSTSNSNDNMESARAEKKLKTVKKEDSNNGSNSQNRRESIQQNPSTPQNTPQQQQNTQSIPNTFMMGGNINSVGGPPTNMMGLQQSGVMTGQQPQNANPQSHSEAYINDLLEHNLKIISNIRGNIAHRKINDNITLISKFRENIIQVLTCMSKMGGIMSRMPPIPVKLNTICIPQQQQGGQSNNNRSTPNQQQ